MHVINVDNTDQDYVDQREEYHDVHNIGNLAMEARERLRNQPCMENRSISHYDENEDCDGPENLCIKKKINFNNAQANSTDRQPHTKTNTDKNKNKNRISLSLKDIRHLNRPSNCQQGIFSGFSSHMSTEEKVISDHQIHKEIPELLSQQHSQR